MGTTLFLSVLSRGNERTDLFVTMVISTKIYIKMYSVFITIQGIPRQGPDVKLKKKKEKKNIFLNFSTNNTFCA